MESSTSLFRFCPFSQTVLLQEVHFKSGFVGTRVKKMALDKTVAMMAASERAKRLKEKTHTPAKDYRGSAPLYNGTLVTHEDQVRDHSHYREPHPNLRPHPRGQAARAGASCRDAGVEHA